MAASGPGRYISIYGVGLLDDLHNYFPALLYDTGRFQTVPSVFHYIRTQMNSRFNLFSYGARVYNDTRLQETTPPPPPTTRFPSPVTRFPIPSTTPILQTVHIDEAQAQAQAQEENVLDTLSATSLLLGLLGAGMDTTPTLANRVRLLQPGLRTPTANERWASFTQPVVVRPSQTIIEQNTELLTGTSEFSCAICQDRIRVDETARRLRPCNHVYHRSCIDQWFERSVNCPTCRHDIRVAATTTTTQESSLT